MKKTLSVISVIFAVAILAACGGNGSPVTTSPDSADTVQTVSPETDDVTTKEDAVKNVVIHSISELNTKTVAGSHNGDTSLSCIEPDFRTMRLFGISDLRTPSAYYPRLKKLADGSYILFYQDGRWGPNILYKTSEDLKTWSSAKYLFRTGSAGGDIRDYATCDAAVLQNGDILAVCSYRPESTYQTRLDLSGLMVKTSSDNGKTWSDEKIVYVGMNWEPYVLQRKSGEIQIFFTHTAPYVHLYGYNNTIRSSGSAIIRSYDNGQTWTPFVTGAPYEAWRVMQSYDGDLNGIKIFNDQMPVAVELQDGTVAIACETQSIDRKFTISLGWDHDNFAKALAIDEVGPADRQTSFTSGTGPYIAAFPSGETLLSFSNGARMRLMVGNENAKNFTNEIIPWGTDYNNLWGSLEVISGNAVVFTGAHQPVMQTGTTDSQLTFGIAYLNHTPTGSVMTPVIDGDSSDWDGNTDALFLGAQSQAQCCFRFARDSENIYILCERLDSYMKTGDSILLFFTAEKGYYKMEVTYDGIKSLMRNTRSFEAVSFDDIKCGTAISGKTGEQGDETYGWVNEIAIPLSYVGDPGAFRFTAALKNADKEGRSEQDTFASADLANTSRWFRIKFE